MIALLVWLATLDALGTLWRALAAVIAVDLVCEVFHETGQPPDEVAAYVGRGDPTRWNDLRATTAAVAAPLAVALALSVVLNVARLASEG